MQTVGDLANYSLLQEVALATCDERRAALVELIDAQGEAAKPKRRWKLWR